MMKCLLYHFLNVMQKNEHENDPDEVGAKYILKKFLPPEIKQRVDQVYYHFNCVDLNIELQ